MQDWFLVPKLCLLGNASSEALLPPLDLQHNAMRQALLIVLFTSASAVAALGQNDPLPSWNDGPAKQSIIAFVTGATSPTGLNFIPPAERIATFDNDGTL